MFIKKLLIITALLVLIAAAVTAYANIAVNRAGLSGIYTVDKVPPADAAIVLGAKVYTSGAPSHVLADRLETGVELYKKGKVKKLLMTGDHGTVTYDEVNNMRLYALERGVPEDDIFMDHAGFSTYDSMYRARDIFQIKTAIIVTQKFHLPRALYIARVMDLEVSGTAADKRAYAGAKIMYFREIFARTKAAAQLAIGMKPKYLGPAIPISGDGRMTKDKI